ncbi:hypothetical protein COF68_05270 [Bacillus toyonensis]|uniref:hypothetical protein n=1 Tax=Bacillus toyonensis TaxID=155322 RepID=UPI000BFD59A9|nr:hypothetical protein [Bacillus toyonensis]PHE64254.1 hypothetical protein COF68_05270 [Bacillus toyonensis]
MFIIKTFLKYFEYIVRIKSTNSEKQINGEKVIFEVWLWRNFLLSLLSTTVLSSVTLTVIQGKLGYFSEFGYWVLTPMVVYVVLTVANFMFFKTSSNRMERKVKHRLLSRLQVVMK